MSLLGTQVYANPDTPCWLGTSGGTVDGSLAVNGSVNATGVITSGGQMQAGTGFSTTESLVNAGYQIAGGAGQATNIQHLPAPASRTVIQSQDPIVFSKIGVANGNTVLTTSAFGANTDQLQVLGTVSTINLDADNLMLLGTGAPNAIVGTSRIVAGSAVATVNTTAVTAGSTIFVSHSGASGAGPPNGSAQGNLSVDPAFINPGVSFRVELTDALGVLTPAAGVDAYFNWLIIN